MLADKNKIREIIADVIEVDEDSIGFNDDFVSVLSMNSLQMLDCLAEVEDVYNIRMPREDIHTLTNINNIAEYLENNNG